MLLQPGDGQPDAAFLLRAAGPGPRCWSRPRSCLPAPRPLEPLAVHQCRCRRRWRRPGEAHHGLATAAGLPEPRARWRRALPDWRRRLPPRAGRARVADHLGVEHLVVTRHALVRQVLTDPSRTVRTTPSTRSADAGDGAASARRAPVPATADPGQQRWRQPPGYPHRRRRGAAPHPGRRPAPWLTLWCGRGRRPPGRS